jgi:DNA invertase Pin-like site-specific DNA recombinase
MNSERKTESHPLITPEHLARFAVVYLRQSSPQQVQNNNGSTAFQRDLVVVARSYGWPDSQIKVIDEDLGRSGSTTEGRTGWQSLQEIINADQVGAVFVVNVSRLARQVSDFELFRMRAALHKTLLYSDGRLSDLANSNDAVISQLMAMVAQFENRKRTETLMQSRMAKAKRGEVVSRLPVGWVKGPDNRYDYDPETKDIIQTIIDTFRQTRGIYRTVKALAKAGVQIPCRKRGGKLCFNKPTTGRVTLILINPAYAGSYLFGRTEPGGPVPGSGRLKLSQERCIKIPNHHPAYMTPEEQEEIKMTLRKNQSKRRSPVARERMVIQGLLRCALCGGSVVIGYSSRRSNSYNYMCRRPRYYGEKPCIVFECKDLEQCILREVFKVLNAPPIEVLKSALEESRKKKQTRQSWIQSERERLAREESLAQEQADLTRGKLPSVHFDALVRLDKVLHEKKQFEQKIAVNSVAASHDESEEELQELCRIATEVASLWEHEAVTYSDRQQILRCLIDQIVVTANRERVDATIVWKARSRTSLVVWRGRSRHHLIRELHEQQLTVSEIRAHLAAGKTSTGQSADLTEGAIQKSLQRMAVKANKYSASRLAVRRKAAELHAEGKSYRSVAQYFNDQGFASASGKSWTHFMVNNLLHAKGLKQEPLENIVRNSIAEARA